MPIQVVNGIYICQHFHMFLEVNEELSVQFIQCMISIQTKAEMIYALSLIEYQHIMLRLLFSIETPYY